jgi:ionotropic glutamate receptor
MDAMKNDFQTTGKCDLALVREKEYALPWVWALAKKSLYTESINRGLVHILLLPINV